MRVLWTDRVGVKWCFCLSLAHFLPPPLPWHIHDPSLRTVGPASVMGWEVGQHWSFITWGYQVNFDFHVWGHLEERALVFALDTENI